MTMIILGSSLSSLGQNNPVGSALDTLLQMEQRIFQAKDSAIRAGLILEKSRWARTQGWNKLAQENLTRLEDWPLSDEGHAQYQLEEAMLAYGRGDYFTVKNIAQNFSRTGGDTIAKKNLQLILLFAYIQLHDFERFHESFLAYEGDSAMVQGIWLGVEKDLGAHEMAKWGKVFPALYMTTHRMVGPAVISSLLKLTALGFTAYSTWSGFYLSAGVFGVGWLVRIHKGQIDYIRESLLQEWENQQSDYAAKLLKALTAHGIKHQE